MHQISLLVVTKIVLESAQKLFLKKLWFVSCTLEQGCHLESVSTLTKTPGLLSEATYLLQIAHHQNRHLVHFYKSLFWWWAIRRTQICSENNPGVFDDSETDSKVISLPQVYMRQTITSLGIASVHFPRRFLSPLKVRFGAFLPLIDGCGYYPLRKLVRQESGAKIQKSSIPKNIHATHTSMGHAHVSTTNLSTNTHVGTTTLLYRYFTQTSRKLLHQMLLLTKRHTRITRTIHQR